MHTMAVMTQVKYKRPKMPIVEASVDAIQAYFVPYYWDFVRQYVNAALEHANGELRADDVYKDLLSGRMRLFVVKQPHIVGAATCEVVQYARKRAVRVVTLGGDDFDAWKGKLHEVLCNWAKEIEAAGIEAYVRRGLVEKLEDLGYSQTYVGMWYGQKLGHQHSDR